MTRLESFRSDPWAAHHRISCVLLAILLLLSGSRRALAVDMDQYQQMLDLKQYQPLLSQLNVELSKKTTNAEDRYAFLLLKGEALLRMKAGGSAQDAFTAAAQIAPDAKSISIAKATVNLIKHSSGGKYQPKTKTADSSALPAGIDIIDPTSRKSAFSAFLTDLIAKLTPQMSDVDNLSLSSVMSLAPQIADAHDVEIAASGADTQTKDLLDKLATRAGTLLGDALKPLDEQIKTVTTDAEKRQKIMGRRATKDQFGSLSPDDVGTLDNAVGDARQVLAAIKQLLPIVGDQGDLKTVQSDAEKIITDANKLLTQYHHPAA